MTIYRVQIYSSCNRELIALEQPQSSCWIVLSLYMVRAGYVCVAIIHQTLTWTTGSLSGAHMLMHAIAHGGARTTKDSLHWKLTLGRKSLAAPGNRTCVCGVMVWCSNQLSYILSQEEAEVLKLLLVWHLRNEEARNCMGVNNYLITHKNTLTGMPKAHQSQTLSLLNTTTNTRKFGI